MWFNDVCGCAVRVCLCGVGVCGCVALFVSAHSWLMHVIVCGHSNVRLMFPTGVFRHFSSFLCSLFVFSCFLFRDVFLLLFAFSHDFVFVICCS